MIETYVREFCAIVGHLQNKGIGIQKKGFLFIEKNKLVEMLNKNAYETPLNKLLAWRDLGWIDADGEHLTRLVSVEGKRVRMVKINLTIFHRLEALLC